MSSDDPYETFFVTAHKPDAKFQLNVVIRSKTDPEKTYSIVGRHGSKRLECSCPHFVFRLRKQGKCKHIQQYEELTEEGV